MIINLFVVTMTALGCRYGCYGDGNGNGGITSMRIETGCSVEAYFRGSAANKNFSVEERI